ncbi:MAG TPA: hypothetical protein VES40_14540 [Ilumatobacteraceae bacterium]|nr:hypothetical protein [Ilumatobacteraceae bacterium]
MTTRSRARVTQRVTIDDLADLVSNPQRAALAFSTSNGPECVPVVVRSTDRFEVGLDRHALDGVNVPDRATLVVDDGRYWFELRAIVRRGELRRVPANNESLIVRFTFETHTSAAWDYGALHEERQS